jgi:ABC-type transport system involved in multi-copper enzyme maturation permease subunit
MKEIKLLLRNEIINHFSSYKFYLALIFPLVVAILTVTIQIVDYKDSLQIYNQKRTTNLEIIKNFRTYSEFQVPILLKPNLLSIFSKGENDKIGNSVIISLTSLPEFKNEQQRSNPFLDIFSNLDLITVIILILSIFIIFIVSDSITNDRENESLKLMFIGNLTRGKYFVSKYLANLITFTIPVFLIFFVSIIIIELHPFAALTMDDYLKLLILFLSCILFISCYIIISLLISSISIDSSNAIIKSLSVWLFLTIIYPGTINFVVNEFGKYPSEEILNEEISNINIKLEDELNNNIKWSDKPLNFSLFTGFAFAGLPEVVGLTEKYNFEVFENAVNKNIPILLKTQQHIINLKNEFIQNNLNQSKKYSMFHFFVPGHLLESFSNELTLNSQNYYYEELYPKLLVYRSDIINYLKKKDAIGIKYFTQVQKTEFKDIFDEYSNEIMTKYNEVNYPKLKTDDIPAFQLNSKFNISIHFYLLVFINFSLLAICFRIFNSLKIIKND